MICKDKLKGFVTGILVTALISLSVCAFAAGTEKDIKVAFSNIKININGQVITPKDASGNTVEPFSYNGTVYLPVRAISEALGKTVSWDGDSNTVKIENGSGTQPEGRGMERPDSAQMPESIKSSLSALVSAGTITQEQAEKLLTYYSTPSVNTDQRTAGERVDPLSKAVTDGVLTQAEAENVRKALMPDMGAKQPMN